MLIHTLARYITVLLQKFGNKPLVGIKLALAFLFKCDFIPRGGIT